MSINASPGFKFEIEKSAENSFARTGTLTTPNGVVETPAFIPVGTKATVKSVLPEAMRELGAQALLSNAYHLYLQPGPEILDEVGGLSAKEGQLIEFMKYMQDSMTPDLKDNKKEGKKK